MFCTGKQDKRFLTRVFYSHYTLNSDSNHTDKTSTPEWDETHTLFVLSISVELFRCSTIPEMQSGPAKPSRSAMYRKVLLRRIGPPKARYIDFQMDGDFSGSSVFCCQNLISNEVLVNQDFITSVHHQIINDNICS